MIKVELKQRGQGFKDISTECGDISISGALEAVARKLELDILRDGVDVYKGKAVKRGEVLRVSDNGTLIFQGLIWEFEESDNDQFVKVVAYDKLKFFTVSQVQEGNFVGKTPKEVTERLCKEVGVTFGECPDSDEKININCREKTGYATLMQVWTAVKRKTGKPYYPVLKDQKLAIIEKGKAVPDLTLAFRTEPKPGTLIDVHLQESSEEACTALILTDDQGHIVQESYNKDLMALYGYIQKVRENKVSKDAVEINGGQVVMSCEAIGDWRCVTGYAVQVDCKLFKALMYIESDHHTYVNGIHEMSLVLSYDNVMDEAESDSDDDKEYSEKITGEPGEYTVIGYCNSAISDSFITKDGEQKPFTSMAAPAGFGKTAYIPHFKDFPGGGNFTVTATTKGLDDKTVAVFFADCSEADAFGKRTLTVYKDGKRTLTAISTGGGSGGRATGNSNAAKIWNALRDLGYSAAAVAGILGNLERESGLNPNIAEVGGTGNGRGLAQWDVRNRWQDLLNWAKSNGLDPTDVVTQAQFIDVELNGSQSAFANSHGGLDAFKNISDPQEAVAWFYDVFERGLNRGSDLAKSNPIAQGYYDKWASVDRAGEGGGGDFPDYNGAIDPGNLGYVNQCTWYCYNRYYSITGQSLGKVMGNGGQWSDYARSYGYPVSSEPFAGAFMCQPPGTTKNAVGGYGHIAFVESVDSDGTVHTSEMWGSYGDGVVRYETYPPDAAARCFYIDLGVS